MRVAGLIAAVLFIVALLNFPKAAGAYHNCRQDAGVVDVCASGAAVVLFEGDKP